MNDRPKKSKSLCVGCWDNFYNGRNPYGVKECWSFKSARVCRKRFVPLDRRPPWDDIPWDYTLTCHRKEWYSGIVLKGRVKKTKKTKKTV